jgi:hypothetical protein
MAASTLLSLSANVRESIYEAILPRDGQIFCTADPAFAHEAAAINTPDGSQQRRMVQDCVRLMQVCSTVYQELSAIPYRRIGLQFTFGANLNCSYYLGAFFARTTAHGELALFKKPLSYFSADGPYDSIFQAAVYLIRLGVDITNTDHHRGVGNENLAGIVEYQDGDGRVISSDRLADLPLWERVLCVREGVWI